MSSEIPQRPFTYHYSQPKDYHFSLDSIHLPWIVGEGLNNKNKTLNKDYRVMDLCSGCGVMGFELAFYHPWISRIDFVELQSEYLSHFEVNQKTVSSDLQSKGGHPEFHLYLQNYETLPMELNASYDLILCNPPYFFNQTGTQSPSAFKNRCRFFLDSNLDQLILTIARLLKPSGEAHLITFDNQDHSINTLNEIEKFKNLFSNITYQARIRRAHHVVLQK